MNITKEQITAVVESLIGMEYAVIDLFCGAGGTSTGIAEARYNNKQVAKVVLCVNHDPWAIKSHEENHPDAIHAVEDVRKVKMKELKPLIFAIRKAHPDMKIILWASLECTNFSKAKGGQARDADSRTLAQDMLRYIKAIKPEMIYIENVEEFMSWGPLDSLGKPISKQAGVDYVKWLQDVCNCDYKHEHRIINSADLGAYTSRKRYFGQFIRPDADFKWPEETHSKKLEPGKSSWMPVKDVLNLQNHGNSVFNRKKELSPKTLERILVGAKRYVNIQTPSYFIKYHGTGANVLSLSGPASSLTTKDRLAIIKTQFIDKQYTSGGRNQSIDVPAGSITTVPKMNLVTCQPFLMNGNTSTGPCKNIEDPAPTVTCGRTHYLINPQWFNKSPISIDKPCPTLIARMDKAPMSIATAETSDSLNVYIRKSYAKKVQRVHKTSSGDLVYTFKASDHETMKDLIMFMASKGIVDIKMRMLEIDELLKIQGFPDSYVLKGTKTLQKKFIGNSVVPLAAKKLIEANFN